MGTVDMKKRLILPRCLAHHGGVIRPRHAQTSGTERRGDRATAARKAGRRSSWPATRRVVPMSPGQARYEAGGPGRSDKTETPAESNRPASDSGPVALKNATSAGVFIFVGGWAPSMEQPGPSHQALLMMNAGMRPSHSGKRGLPGARRLCPPSAG
jgi:hypothetical protein